MARLKNWDLELKDKARYDIVGLGALVVRLDPGDESFRDARSFLAHVSGAEYNPVANVTRYGKRGAFLTAMADYCLGDLIRERVRAVGVELLGPTLKHTPWDGHHALVFSGTPRGRALNRIDYNRSGETAVKLKPGDLKYDELLEGGVRWVHSGGLYAALGKHTPELIIEFFRKAKEQGAVVSFDLNYRGKLWEANGGQKRAIEAMTEIVKVVDVLFANETDMQNALGIEASVAKTDALDTGVFKEVQEKVRKKFPNLKVAVTSLRHEMNNDRHLWGAVASVGGKIHEVPSEEISVVCRIGGGDGLAGGFISGIMNDLAPQEALRAGWASGLLVASVRGDITRSTWQDVLDVASGSSKKVQR